MKTNILFYLFCFPRQGSLMTWFDWTFNKITCNHWHCIPNLYFFCQRCRHDFAYIFTCI